MIEFKKHLLPFWDKYKAPTSFVIGAIVSSTIQKGCDVVVDRFTASPHNYTISEIECANPEPLSPNDDKKSWKCAVTIKNETKKDRTLNVICRTSAGNFYGAPEVLNRGGGANKLSDPNCFDNLNNSEKKCSMSLQEDEYIKLEFKAVSYDQPTFICNSDSF